MPNALLFSVKPCGSLCLYGKDFEKYMEDMKSRFHARGCPQHLNQKSIKEVKSTSINMVKRQKWAKRVTFVVTYHPLLKSLQSLINKHFNILRIDKEVKKVLKPSPVVTYFKATKLSCDWVRAKLYPLKRETVSSKGNGKCCAVFKNVNEASTLTSSVIHGTY